MKVDARKKPDGYKIFPEYISYESNFYPKY